MEISYDVYFHSLLVQKRGRKKCPRNSRVKKWRTFSTGFILDRWDEIHTLLGSVRATLRLRERAPEVSLHPFFFEKFGHKKCPRYSEPKKWRTFWSGILWIDIGSLKFSISQTRLITAITACSTVCVWKMSAIFQAEKIADIFLEFCSWSLWWHLCVFDKR